MAKDAVSIADLPGSSAQKLAAQVTSSMRATGPPALDHGATPTVTSHAAQEAADKEKMLLQEKRKAARKAAEARIEAEAAKMGAEAAAAAHCQDVLFTVPSAPRAGQQFMLYYNPSSSVAWANAIPSCLACTGGYNNWDLQGFKDLVLETSALHRDMAALVGFSNTWTNWRQLQLAAPQEAFNLQCVFSDGAETFDNNAGADFKIDFTGGPTEAEYDTLKAEIRMRELAEAEVRAAAAAEAAISARERSHAYAAMEVLRAAHGIAISAQKISNCLEAVCYTIPKALKAGEPALIYYRPDVTSLRDANTELLTLRYGYNGWAGVLPDPVAFRTDEDKAGWFFASIDIVAHACSVDFVVSAGDQYDNNDRADYHALVSGGESLSDSYWDTLVELDTQKMKFIREEALATERRVRAEREGLRAEKMQLAMQKYQASQERVVRSTPLTSGMPVTVFYNAGATHLAGRSNIFLKYGFDRWARDPGMLGPILMTPVEDIRALPGTAEIEGTWFSCDIPILPAPVHTLDAVFCDGLGRDAVYDNNDGMDFHFHVQGKQQPGLRITHIAVEMAPIAKVGGMADVVSALGKAMQGYGHHVEVILPKYDCVDYNNVEGLKEIGGYSWGGCFNRVWSGRVDSLRAYFIGPENGFFNVGTVYGRNDDAARFGFFNVAALEFLLQRSVNNMDCSGDECSQPDIIHTHDWSAALAATRYWSDYHNSGLWNPKVVFTIHNLNYGQDLIGQALMASQMATTVSPTYAKEVGGHGAIGPHSHKFRGILNGIDTDFWDPSQDPNLPRSYSIDDCVEGKASCKRELRRRLGLPDDDSPLVTVVSRLTAQKGLPLIKHAMHRAQERGAQFVLLGSAPDPKVQAEFQSLASQFSHGNKVRLVMQFNEPLSHLMYAGADIIVVPSMFEPCGLTQMIAMRYGTVPVVRKTGGLNDTVFDIDHDADRAEHSGIEGGPNGFVFEGTDNGALDYALNRAIDAWYGARDWWNRELVPRIMKQDWSWNGPALEYAELYHAARQK